MAAPSFPVSWPNTRRTAAIAVAAAPVASILRQIRSISASSLLISRVLGRGFFGGFHRDRFDFDALDRRIARIGNDHVPQLETADDFQIVAVVSADLNPLEMHGSKLGRYGVVSARNTCFTAAQSAEIGPLCYQRFCRSISRSISAETPCATPFRLASCVRLPCLYGPGWDWRGSAHLGWS